MMTENGIVIRSTQATAWIKTTRTAACEGCSSKDSCGTSHHGSQEMTVAVKNTLGVEKGDAVIIGIESRPMIILSFLTYVFPILLLVVGALIGDSIAPLLGINASLTAIAIGFSSFAAAFLLLRKLQPRLSGKEAFHPFLVRKRAPSKSGPCPG